MIKAKNMEGNDKGGRKVKKNERERKEKRDPFNCCEYVSMYEGREALDFYAGAAAHSASTA